jgi:hypothetical protein
MKTTIFKYIVPVFLLAGIVASCEIETFPEATVKEPDYSISTNSLILNTTINDLDFIGVKNGFAVGNIVTETVTQAAVLKTTNGGKDWTKLVIPTLLGQLYSNYFIDANTGWTVGNLGTILYTTDAGVTFKQAVSGTAEILYGVTFFDKNKGVCVGAKGVLLTTINGGLTWTKQNSGVTADLRAVYMKDAATIVVCGASGVLRISNDFAQTWTAIDTKQTIRFQDMHFPVQDIGYACGQSGIVIKIDLRNNTVTQLFLPVNDQQRGIYFVNEKIGYSAGQYGELIKTIDGGATWKLQNIDPIAHNMYAVDFPTASKGYVAGVKTFLTSNAK